MPKTISDLPQVNSVSNSDLLIVEVNPNSVPNTKTISVTNFKNVIQSQISNLQSNAVSFQANVANTSAVTLDVKISEKLSVRDFGAVGGGVANDTLAFQKAAAVGRPIAVPYIPGGYNISSQINMSNGTFFYAEGGMSEIILTSASSARLFDAQGCTRVGLRGLRLNGNKSVTPTGAFVRFRDVTYGEIVDCEVIDAPGDSIGAVVFSGNTVHSKVLHTRFIDSENTAMSLTGEGVKYNTVEQCEFIGGGGFGVRLGEQASHNKISNNKCLNTGIEGIATAWGANFNVINNNFVQGAGDNGISLSGDYNSAVGNICYKNDRAGIGIWGSYNSINGNVCVSNNIENTVIWAGINIMNGYGGAGQNNIVNGNILDDDQPVLTQYWNVRIGSNVYVLWAQGQTVAANEYRYFGLNIYQAVNGGVTGSTAPVHTSGSVSDGTVTWKFMNTARSAMTPRTNFVSMNHPGRNLSAQGMSDSSGWVNNELFGYGANKRYGSFPTANTGLQQYEWWMDTANGRVIKINS